MFEQLKKQAMKKVMKHFMVCIVIVLVLLGISSTSLMKLIEGPKDLDSLSIEDLPNAYIQTDINAIIDVFAEYYEENDDGTETVTNNYYIIPVGEEEFLALDISKDDFSLADQICDETYEYIMGDRADLTTSMRVTGTINDMSDEIYNYYEDWFLTSGYLENPTTEDLERLALPYILQVDYIGEFDSFVLYAMLFGAGAVLLYAIIILIKGMSGLYLSPIKKYMKQNESSLSTERLEADYMDAVVIGTVRIGKMWTFFFIGKKAHLLKNDELVWAYLEQVTHRVNGIKSGVTKSLVLYTKKKKKYAVIMKNADTVNSALDALSQVQPNMVIGYSDELKKCFNKDFETFMKIPTMRETTNNESTEYNNSAE